MRMSWSVMLGAAMVLAACGGDDGYGTGGASCTPSATLICMRNNAFNPSMHAVTSGTTVTWRNADLENHTTTSNPSNPTECPAWDVAVAAATTSSGVAMTASSTPVTCQYYCRNHGTPTTGMRASLTITQQP